MAGYSAAQAVGKIPVDVRVVCATNQNPAGAGDCVTQFANDRVPVVVNGVTGQAGWVFEPLQKAGIPVFVSFPPSAVTLSLEAPTGSARNEWLATVTSIEQLGSVTRVSLNGTATIRADITPAAAIGLRLAVGQSVWASVKATAIEVYPA